MRKTPKFSRASRFWRIRARRIIWIIAVATLMVGIIGGIAVAVTLHTLPAPQELFSQRIVQSTKIYDRTGAILLYEIHGEVKRTVIPFADIPPSIRNATIATEDANFYTHGGLDFKGILRAVLVDVVARAFQQGGSTITQQLVKKSFLGDERTITRKFREAILAIALDARLEKDQILDLYLNQIPYGSNAYGIEAAAQTFFGKHARELTVAEAALLAGLPRAPSYYSPYGQHKRELFDRKNYIINRMSNLGYITTEEALRAKEEELKFLPATKNIRAPHFVMYVRDYLVQKYGEDEVEQGGLIVTTTLDWKLQEEAEKIVNTYADRNEQLIKAHNMALVAVDPKSGAILTMVGSRDYFDIENDGNYNVATALRQPGSAFKPFVYATAFKKGFTPDTVVFDTPTEFNPLCTKDGVPATPSVRPDECYHPGNYDETFRGPVTFRQAIAQSLNVPSVKVLYLAGIIDAIRTAEELGISTLADRSRFGLSLVLGGAEVKLLDMASAYGVFANDGVVNPATPILKVETAHGKILEEKRDTPRPVLDPDIARTISDVLSDEASRLPIFQPHSSLYFPDRAAAVKTGTTQDYRDAWTIGYTPYISVGVWVGNNDNSPIQQKGSGVMAAAPAWHEFMAFAMQQFPPEAFTAPAFDVVIKPILKGVWQGDTVITIDSVSGKRATEFTPPETRIDVGYGTPHDPLYWIDRNNPTGPPPENPSEDPQYAHWAASFDHWLIASDFQSHPLSLAPSGFDDIHTAERQPKISLERMLESDTSISVQVKGEQPYALRTALFIAPDGQILESYSFPTLPFLISLSRDTLPPDPEEFEVRVYDLVGNRGTASITLP